MDPYLCCAIGLCCPPGSEQQRTKMAGILLKRGVAHTREEADRIVAHDLGLIESFKKMMTQQAGTTQHDSDEA